MHGDDARFSMFLKQCCLELTADDSNQFLYYSNETVRLQFTALLIRVRKTLKFVIGVL